MNFDKIQCLNFAYDIHITSDPEIWREGVTWSSFQPPKITDILKHFGIPVFTIIVNYTIKYIDQKAYL